MAVPARADEIWVAPTYQQDAGGLGVGSNLTWPVTPIGVVRLAWAIPANLQTFQSAKLVLIPSSSSPAPVVTFYLCRAQADSKRLDELRRSLHAGFHQHGESIAGG